MRLVRPSRILEVGSGDSGWLGYFARKTGATVAGIDYSERGCELARNRLRADGLEGRIFCGDLFKLTHEEVGQYDFVYSIGLVEHFDDLVGVLRGLSRFVAPGGILFTEVPNLRSMHGLLSWIWQPELLHKHFLVSREKLRQAHVEIGLEDVAARFSGLFALDVVAWEYYPRWPRIAPKVTPWIRRLIMWIDLRLRRVDAFQGNPLFSPFIHAFGKKAAGQPEGISA